ncbi:MAG TPA: alanine racemase [Myxococcaceae bacterium]|nr:alanine racemase [Myxococcaceae bacterium]
MRPLPRPPSPAYPSPAHPARASYLELDAGALRHNVEVFRALLGRDAEAGVPRRFGAVLKGNAYGHGFEALLPHVHELVDVLYVISPLDALAIRAFERRETRARRQVVVLGAISPEEALELAEEEIDAVISDPSCIDITRALQKAGTRRRLRVHVHLDTGLSREGFTLDQLPTEAAFLTGSLDVLEVVGALSHFANTEDVTEQAFARRQLATFDAGVERLRQLLPAQAPLERHFAASAPTLVLPEARLDCVRIGISLYGLWPSAETRLSARVVLGDLPELRPVLSWRCESQLVKWIEPGSYVGYGCTWRAEERTRIAVLPLGYFDGYPRLFSDRAHVLVNGRRCPVLGRVMMNHIVIDVTRAEPAAPRVLATLLGEDGNARLSAENLAAWAETIHYELLTRIGPHLERRIV